jgi:hypothetical protein
MPELHLIAELAADQQTVKGKCSVCGAPFTEVSTEDLKPMIEQFEQHAVQFHTKRRNFIRSGRSEAIPLVRRSATGNG